MRDGRMPYRDFYFFTQPLSLWISRAILAFGDSMVYFRLYGVIERIAIGGLLYLILRRSFSTAATVCGVLAGSFLFVTYSSDAFFSYLYTTLLFILLSSACLQQAWTKHGVARIIWMSATGFAAIWAFFSKQSSGLLAAFAIGVVILLAARSIREAVRDSCAYVAGCIAGSAPFLLWLIAHSAFAPYLDQVFRGAKDSKGSFSTILFGFFTRELDPFAIVLYLLLAIPLYRASRPKTAANTPQRAALVAIGLAALASPLLCITLSSGTVLWVNYTARIVSRFVLYSLFLAAGWLLWKRLNAIARHESPSWAQRNALAATLITTSWIYGCGMSFSVDQQAALPGLALCLAYLFDRVQIGKKNTGPWLAAGCAAACLFLGVILKWNIGFTWMGWRQPITTADSRSHWPQLAGYRMPPAEAAMFDTILDDIAEHVGPRELLVTTPQIPMFNFISGKHQPFFAPVHCWDVCDDRTARRDAATMRTLRPKMIIELEFDEETRRGQEDAFRKGGPSGQRELTLTRGGHRHTRGSGTF